MDVYMFDNDLLTEALDIFMESEYKSKIRILDLQLDSFYKKYPELRSAEGAIYKIKKSLEEISKDPYVDDIETVRKCFFVFNLIFDLWRKYESWYTVIKLGATAAGTVMGGPVLGIAIMSLDTILLRIINLLFDTLFQYWFVEIQHEMEAMTLKDLITELEYHKKDCIKRRDTKNAALCDKMLKKANNALTKLYK